MHKTILIVEDFKTIRVIVGSALRMKKYNILEAENVEAAESILKREKVDLILSDYNMPGVSGYEFLKSIRQSKDFKNIPFLFLTSEKDKTKMQRAKDAGLDAWIQKPYNLEHFLKTLDYWIEKRSA